MNENESGLAGFLINFVFVCFIGYLAGYLVGGILTDYDSLKSQVKQLQEQVDKQQSQK